LPFELMGLINHRLHLFEGVLSRPDGIAFAQHTAGRAGLDHVRAVLDLIPHRGTDLFRPIGDTGLVIAVCRTGLVSVLVAMAARDPERMSGAEDTRSDRPAFVDRALQRQIIEITCTQIPDRSKTSHQRPLGIPHAEDYAECIRIAKHRGSSLRVAEYPADDVR